MSIQVKNLVHVYDDGKKPAIDDISFEIERGSFTSIIGQTGSGKSSLIQHLNAILLPTSGTIKIKNYLIEKTKGKKKVSYHGLRKKVGLVFQFSEYQLFEETILKDVMFGPMNYNVDEKKAEQLARKYLEMVHISDDLFNRSPFDLSGGQKRRVAIAGILAMEPEIIVLDEPTAGLDPQGSKDVMELFLELKKKYRKTLIVVSHDMDFVYQYSDEVILLDHGKLILKDTTVPFFNNEVIYKHGIAKPVLLKTYEMLNDEKPRERLTFNDVAKQIKDVINNA